MDLDFSNPQSFNAWVRGHFNLDHNELAEISDFITVPGDLDMQDVLSLLADDASAPTTAQHQQPAQALQQQHQQQRQQSITGRTSLDIAQNPLQDNPADAHNFALFSSPHSTITTGMRAQQAQAATAQEWGASVLGMQHGNDMQQLQLEHVQQPLVQLPQTQHPQLQSSAMSSQAACLPNPCQVLQQQQQQLARSSLSIQQQPPPQQLQQGMPPSSGMWGPCAASTTLAGQPASLAGTTAQQIPAGQGWPGSVIAAAAQGYQPVMPMSRQDAAAAAVQQAMDAFLAAPAATVTQNELLADTTVLLPAYANNTSANSAVTAMAASSQYTSVPAYASVAAATGHRLSTAGRGSRAAKAASAADKPGTGLSSAGAAQHSSDSSGGGAGQGATDAVSGGVRRRRRPTEAQRAAHRRFRQRRKEQMASLEAELSAKRAQLSALSLEHAALVAKARALDQLVASAGDDMELLQQLQQLNLTAAQDEQQQQQQQNGHAHFQLQEIDSQSEQTSSSLQPDGSMSQGSPSVSASEPGSSPRPNCRTNSLSSIGNASAVCHVQLPGAAADTVQCHEQTQNVKAKHTATAAAPAVASNDSVQHGISGAATPSAISSRSCSSHGHAGSIEHLEAALQNIMHLNGNNPTNALPSSERLRVQGALTTLQQLLKSFVGQVMQLVLQIGQENGYEANWQLTLQQQQLLQHAVAGAAGAACPADLPLGTTTLYSVNIGSNPLLTTAVKLEDGVGSVNVLPGKLRLADGSGGQAGSSADLAALKVDGVTVSPAAVRLQQLLALVRLEFRKFAISNRLPIYHMQALNFETGMVGAPPPDGHWKQVARVLKDRLDPEVLSDLCVARQLYSSTVVQIKQQRQLLCLQLQQLLERYTNIEAYSSDFVTSDLAGPHCEGNTLLNAIDSNMRKEYALEGIFQFAFHKKVPSLVMAGMIVHSWPYMPDSHAILGELVAQPQQLPALSALQEAQLRQLSLLSGSAAGQQLQHSSLFAQQQLQQGPMVQQMQQQQLPQQPQLHAVQAHQGTGMAAIGMISQGGINWQNELLGASVSTPNALGLAPAVGLQDSAWRQAQQQGQVLATG